MNHADFGTSCGTANTLSSTSASEFRTYWFPKGYDIAAKVKDDTPLDLWDGANDSYKIDDGFYYGLTQYYLRMASANTLVGDKFQYKEPSNDVQWAGVKDYRFKAGDTISIYRLQENTSGTLVWDYNENRTLLGAESGLVTTSAVIASAIAFALAF